VACSKKFRETTHKICQSMRRASHVNVNGLFELSDQASSGACRMLHVASHYPRRNSILIFIPYVLVALAWYLGLCGHSQNVIPHLYNQPAPITTPIFDKIFHKGGTTIMPIATVAIATNCYLAYQSDGLPRRLHGTAAALIFASLPLTKFVMMPGISRIICCC
jgi:hypothetical protein